MNPRAIRAVKALHDAGYDLIPLQGKRPLDRDWVSAERLSWKELRPRLTAESANVGIRLGRPIGDTGKVLVAFDGDVNVALDAEERAKYERACADILGDAEYPTSMTGSGRDSRHVFAVVDVEKPKTKRLAKSSARVEYTKGGEAKVGPAWTWEVRGFGSQVVLPPSIHPDTGQKYQWARKLNGADCIPAVTLSKPVQRERQQPARTGTNLDAAFVRHLPIAPYWQDLLIEGDLTSAYSSRSEALFAVLSVLIRDSGLSDDDIIELLHSPEIALGEKVREKGNNAATWVRGQIEKLRERGTLAGGEAIGEGRNQRALRNYAQIRDSVEQLEVEDAEARAVLIQQIARSGLGPADEEDLLARLKRKTGINLRALRAEINLARPARAGTEGPDDPVYREILDRHCFVNWGGKSAIFRRRIHAESWDSQFDVMTMGDLRKFYANQLVQQGNRMVNPADIWEEDVHREQYLEGARLVPYPQEAPDGVFNLWQGWGASPQSGDVQLWCSFVKNEICYGNEQHAEWVHDWLADLFQDPGNPKGVALVLRGGEGVGKGTFASFIGSLVGAHYRHVTQESQLTGRFNGHFSDSLLVFADEMTWGGDKRNRGALYALVTERHLMVERKNFDAVPMRNLNRMMIASNNEWVVPTGMDGRRWLVLDCSERRKGDTKFFAALRGWFEDGGKEALLDFYLTRHVSHDLRRAPVTRGLVDQKVHALSSIGAWWHDCLIRGSIERPIGTAPPVWRTEVPKESVRISYQTFARDHGSRIEYSTTMLKEWMTLVPSVGTKKTRKGDDRVPTYVIPSLEECRQYFESLLGLASEW